MSTGNSMTSNFDPEQFLNAVITDVQVRRPNLPAGIDVQGVVGEIKIVPWQKKDDPSKHGIKAEVPLVVDTSLIEGQPPTLTLTYEIMMDLNEGGAIDMAVGKNGKLRGFREAVGMNAPGSPFNWRAAQGKVVRAKISHRAWNNELYDEVASVAKA